jgi:alcohol dehydrogenase (NADP+)
VTGRWCGARIRRRSVGPGSVVGVVGLGGLGHLAVKLAKAMGAEVAVFTTSGSKAGPALELGADEVVLTSDAERMGAQRGRFDLIVDTASGQHDPSPYLRALRRGGTLVMLGLPERYEPEAMALLGRNLTVSGS